MKTKITALLISLALAMTSFGTTILVYDNFQTPFVSGNTSNPTFTGWVWENPSRTYSRDEATRNDLAGDSDYPVNQALYFEYNTYGNYALSHTWSSTDTFNLTFNAAGTSWEQIRDRWVRPRIIQADGTILWDPGESASTYIHPWVVADDGNYVWNGVGLYGNSVWQNEPDTQFSFTINASNFTTGTEGSAITLQLYSSGQRGVYFDNVNLTTIPEPTVMFLSSFGILLLLIRRR